MNKSVRRPLGIIDGGYLTFMLGIQGLNQSEIRQSVPEDSLILMDRKSDWRISLFPDYKSRRKEKREKSGEKSEKYAMVKAFRELLERDPSYPTYFLTGYESDDVFSLYHLWRISEDPDYQISDTRYMGVDKDYGQVPGLKPLIRNRHGERPSFDLKLPAYALQPEPPWSWTFTQALFGDKSDSIPRLLSSSGHIAKTEYQYVISPLDPMKKFIRAHERWGDKFFLNLKLVLLPCFGLLVDPPTEFRDLVELLISGSYWEYSRFRPTIIPELLECYHDYLDSKQYVTNIHTEKGDREWRRLKSQLGEREALASQKLLGEINDLFR